MDNKFEKIAVMFIYLLIMTQSAPCISKRKAHYQATYPRTSRDISFGFPSIGFQLRSSISIPGLSNTFGELTFEDNIVPQYQEVKNDSNMFKAQATEANYNKEIDDESDSNDSYTTETPIMDYTSNTETVSTDTEMTTTEDYSLSQRSEFSPAVLHSLLG